MASIVMRITDSASLKSQQIGIPIAPLAAAQIAVAALVGTGVKSFEAAVRWAVPFYINDRLRPGRADMRKFPLDAVIDRSAQMLRRAFSREEEGDSIKQFDPIEMEVKATALAALVIEEVKAAGLYVYTQKLLFASELKAHGHEVLKGLDQRGTEVACASVAIACGLIPPPPSSSTKEHLIYLGPKPIRGPNKSTFAQWVAEGDTLIVEFPLPDMEVGDSARYDHFNAVGGGTRSKNPMRAGLGLGFFVVRHESWRASASRPHGTNYFHALTPLLHYSGSASSAWASTSFESETMLEGLRNGAYEKLEKKLKNKGRTFIAKLKVCPECTEIYSDARHDLKKRCTCAAH